MSKFKTSYITNQNIIDDRISSELIMRETFIRSVTETLENTGIESWSIERIQGAVDMLEKFLQVKEDISDIKIKLKKK